jgi:nitrite reductase [NAD(P)H] large subunit
MITIKPKHSTKPKLVLIGNGMAGAKSLEELTTADPGHYDITVFGSEPYGNYNRIMLSPLLSGDKTLSDIIINSKQWYKDYDINLQAGPEKTVTKIDRMNKQLISADGNITDYHRLVIATGSSPFILPIEGSSLK